MHANILQELDDITLHIYNDVLREVECQMHIDWYVSFLESSFYTKMMAVNKELLIEQSKRRKRDAVFAWIDFREILDIPE